MSREANGSLAELLSAAWNVSEGDLVWIDKLVAPLLGKKPGELLKGLKEESKEVR